VRVLERCAPSFEEERRSAIQAGARLRKALTFTFQRAANGSFE
jgi:hypothetical protein